MNKSERIKKYLKFISSWLQTNVLESTELFACLETKNEPYGVLLTDSRYKTDNGKELYTILKGSTIPFYSTVDRRDVLINKLIDTGVIEQKNGRYVFLQNSPRLTIGTVRKLVNTTDGRWPLPLFSTLELGINTEFKLKEPVSRLNKTFNYSGIKLQIVQGIFIINDKIIKLSFEEVIDYVLQHYGKKVSMYDFADSTSSFMNNIISGDRVKEAEHSILSDSANKSEETDSLSEKAQQQSADIANRIYKENKERERIEYEKQLKSFKYAFNESKPYIEKQLKYNQSKMDMALSGLETNQTVYITGLSRSGKTFLCKEIAGKFCNIDTSNIKHKAVYYNNLMWVSCNMDIDKFTRKLAEFCVHNKNNKCLLVINEATKDKLCELLPMWEDMDAEGKNYKDFLYSEKGLDFECDGEIIKIPKGLCILANVADGQNVHDLAQVVNRFVKHINMNEITDDIVYLSRYTGIRQDIFEFLIEMQNTILSQYENEDAFIVIYKLKYETLCELKRYYKHGMTFYEDLAKLDILKKYIEELEYAGA